MISKKAKDRPGDNEELQLLIDRMDNENAALSKILNRIQPGISIVKGLQKVEAEDKGSKSKSI